MHKFRTLSSVGYKMIGRLYLGRLPVDKMSDSESDIDDIYREYYSVESAKPETLNKVDTVDAASFACSTSISGKHKV